MRDNTVRCGWRTLQLLPDSTHMSYAGTRILIREYDDGKLEVVSNAGIIDAKEVPHKPLYFAASGQKPEYDSDDIPKWLESILRKKNGLEESSNQPGVTPIRRPTMHQQARWDAVQETKAEVYRFERYPSCST